MGSQDIAGGLLGLLGHTRQHAAFTRIGSVRLTGLHAISLQAGNHLIEANVIRPAGQLVPAVGTAGGVDQAGSAERHQHLVEKRSGDGLPAGDLAALQRAPANIAGQLQDGPHTVFGLHRKAHAHDHGSLKVDRTGQVYRTPRPGLGLNRYSEGNRHEQRAQHD